MAKLGFIAKEDLEKDYDALLDAIIDNELIAQHVQKEGLVPEDDLVENNTQYIKQNILKNSNAQHKSEIEDILSDPIFSKHLSKHIKKSTFYFQYINATNK